MLAPDIKGLLVTKVTVIFKTVTRNYKGGVFPSLSFVCCKSSPQIQLWSLESCISSPAGSGLQMHFDASRAQGTCLVAVNVLILLNKS